MVASQVPRDVGNKYGEPVAEDRGIKIQSRIAGSSGTLFSTFLIFFMFFF
jgi:hypothetical protein